MPSPLTFIAETVKATPPAIVSALHVGGLSLADWVTVLTLFYLMLQIGLVLMRYIHSFRRWHNRNRREQ